MTGETSKLHENTDPLEDSVRSAHVSVDTGVQGEPIQNFSCRELPLGRLELFDISIDPIAIYRRTEDIAKDSNDDYLLATQMEGTVVVKEGDVESKDLKKALDEILSGKAVSVKETKAFGCTIKRVN